MLRAGPPGLLDGGGMTTGCCLRIAVGGWPIIRDNDQGMSKPARPAAQTYRAISRWSVG